MLDQDSDGVTEDRSLDDRTLDINRATSARPLRNSSSRVGKGPTHLQTVGYSVLLRLTKQRGHVASIRDYDSSIAASRLYSRVGALVWPLH